MRRSYVFHIIECYLLILMVVVGWFVVRTLKALSVLLFYIVFICIEY